MNKTTDNEDGNAAHFGAKRRFFDVLHMGAIKSPADAVRAAIGRGASNGGDKGGDRCARQLDGFWQASHNERSKIDDRGNYSRLRFIPGLEVVLQRLLRMGF